MLSKTFRMKKNSDFNYVLKKGQPEKSRIVTFYFVKNNSNDIKIGVVVSKKIGNSVTRNRIKRLIRESIHKYVDKIKCGYKLVFIARNSIDISSFDEIDNVIFSLLTRNNLLIEHENI